MILNLALSLLSLGVNGLKLQSTDVYSFIQQQSDPSMISVFGSLDLNYSSSRVGLLRLLRNNCVDLWSYYFDVCEDWTFETFKIVADWSIGLSKQERQSILAPECAASLEYDSEKAILYLVEMGLPVTIADVDFLTKSHWIKLLNSEDYELFDAWCSVIPEMYLDKEFFEHVDISKVATNYCIERNYPNKEIIMDYLERKLPDMDAHSITRLIVTLTTSGQRKVWKSELVNKLKDLLTQRFTGTLLDNLHALSLDITGLKDEMDFHDEFCEYLSSPAMSHVERFDTIRLWNYVADIEHVSTCLKKIPELDISDTKFSTLAYDLNHFSIETRRGYFENLGKNYDDYIIRLDLDLDGLLDLNIPIDLKLKYYRYSKVALSSRALHSDSLRKRMKNISSFDGKVEYISGQDATFENIKEEFMVLLEREKSNLHIYRGEDPKDLVIIRPRTWLPRKELVHIISVMLYTIVVFGRPVANLDPRFCIVTFLKGMVAADIKILRQSQIQNHPFTDLGNPDLLKTEMRERIKNLFIALENRYLTWKLDYLFPRYCSICEILATKDIFSFLSSDNFSSSSSCYSSDSQQSESDKKIDTAVDLVDFNVPGDGTTNFINIEEPVPFEVGTTSIGEDSSTSTDGSSGSLPDD